MDNGPFPPSQEMCGRRQAVVLGMSPNGLAVARSLGRKGIPVVGIRGDVSGPGLGCGYLSAKYICPYVQDEEASLDPLTSLGEKRRERGVLILTADGVGLFCSKYRMALSEYYAFNLPSQEIIECFLDKKKISRFAERNGIPHPATAIVNNEETLKKSASDLEYACMFIDT
jgi:D-aspartate ligase